MKLVYKCHYDGKTCDKEIPKVDVKGNVCLPTNCNIPGTDCNGYWETCIHCDRNCSMSGKCYGNLQIEY